MLLHLTRVGLTAFCVAQRCGHLQRRNPRSVSVFIVLRLLLVLLWTRQPCFHGLFLFNLQRHPQARARTAMPVWVQNGLWLCWCFCQWSPSHACTGTYGNAGATLASCAGLSLKPVLARDHSLFIRVRCAGPCSAGSYCPAGSSSPTQNIWYLLSAFPSNLHSLICGNSATALTAPTAPPLPLATRSAPQAPTTPTRAHRRCLSALIAKPVLAYHSISALADITRFSMRKRSGYYGLSGLQTSAFCTGPCTVRASSSTVP